MQLKFVLRLLLLLLTINELCAQSLQVRHPDSGNINIEQVIGDHFTANQLQDPFINIVRTRYSAPGFNYFAVTNGTPVIESKFMVPENPENILREYIIEFRRCDYPFTIHRINENTYLFTGEVGEQVKKVLVAYDPEKRVSLCSFTCETNDHLLMQKRQKTLERFPELDRLPGELIYFKEYHQGPITSICAKVEFRANAYIALEELSARFTQFGWRTHSARIMNHQDFTKDRATARISAIEGRNTATALIVISDQSQLSH